MENSILSFLFLCNQNTFSFICISLRNVFYDWYKYIYIRQHKTLSNLPFIKKILKEKRDEKGNNIKEKIINSFSIVEYKPHVKYLYY